MNKKEYIALLNYQQLSPTVRKGLEQLIEERFKLEKALDKACGLLKEAVSQDCYIFDEVIEENYSYITEKEEWKEWCLKDENS